MLVGLYLVVQPSGAKSFAVRYRYAGQPRKLTLGAFPAITLEAARDIGGKALRAAAEGRDPATEKQAAKGDAKKARWLRKSPRASVTCSKTSPANSSSGTP